MKEIKWDEVKIRCSSAYKVMTEPKDARSLTPNQLKLIEDYEAKATLTDKQAEDLASLIMKRDAPPKLSDTCTTYLLEVYGYEKYGKEPISFTKKNKYCEKGWLVEDDSITLLSLTDRKFYSKNEEHVWNDYLKGTPDIYLGASIMEATKIIDIKSKFGLDTFLQVIFEPTPPVYDWQINCYMDITGAKEGEIAHTLVNTPDNIIQNELRKLLYEMDVATDENPEYKKAAEKLINNMTFDNIPAAQRIYKVPIVKRDMSPMYKRIEMCRTWLAEFDEKFMSINKKK